MKKTKTGYSKNIIGGRVRKARLAQKPPVSQQDLAGRLAALGVSIDRSAISRIENQERYVMDYEIAVLAKALKVTAGWMFGEE